MHKKITRIKSTSTNANMNPMCCIPWIYMPTREMYLTSVVMYIFLHVFWVTTKTLFNSYWNKFWLYIHIYIYMCVFVCVFPVTTCQYPRATYGSENYTFEICHGCFDLGIKGRWFYYRPFFRSRNISPEVLSLRIISYDLSAEGTRKVTFDMESVPFMDICT